MTQDTRWEPLRQENDAPRMSRRPPLAGHRDSYPELRYRRAQALCAHITQIVSPAICEHTERNLRRDVVRDLMEFLFDEGVEMITDQDREAAGLAPRGVSGMTAHELWVLEMHRLDAMTRPITMTVDHSSTFGKIALSRLGTGEPPTL